MKMKHQELLTELIGMPVSHVWFSKWGHCSRINKNKRRFNNEELGYMDLHEGEKKMPSDHLEIQTPHPHPRHEPSHGKPHPHIQISAVQSCRK
jgi:hypothetical protein